MHVRGLSCSFAALALGSAAPALAAGLGGGASAADLMAALRNDAPAATAYIAGLMDATLLRGFGGDPEVTWLHRCVSARFLLPEQVAAGLGPWLDAYAQFEDAPPAADAVMAYLAEQCAR